MGLRVRTMTKGVSADCGDVHNRGSDGTLGVGER